tara:strand:+ start:806 stop:1201 length:396 start_codon:yes stop_codon:yes gene_type:complete
MVKVKLEEIKLKDVKVTASFTWDGKRINISEHIGYIGFELNKKEQRKFAQMIKESWIDKKKRENLLKRTKEEIALDKLLRSGVIGAEGKRKSPRRKRTNASHANRIGYSNGQANQYYPQEEVPTFINGEHL